MTNRIEKHGLQVDPILVDFIEGDALAGTGVSADAFWSGLSGLVHELGPKNRELLAKRSEIQGQIDDWHRAQKGAGIDAQSYLHYLY